MAIVEGRTTPPIPASGNISVMALACLLTTIPKFNPDDNFSEYSLLAIGKKIDSFFLFLVFGTCTF